MKIFAFTDGGCSNNGKQNAFASFASVIVDGKSKKIIRGKVLPLEFFLENNKIKNNDKQIQPSNNRGELLGIIHCLNYLVEKIKYYFVQNVSDQSNNHTITINDKIEVDIITDSLISIKTFNLWLPARRKKNTAHELKNFDLISIAETLLNQCREKYTVNFIHVNSHQKKPDSDKNDTEYDKKYFFWKGNQLADEHCFIALKNENYDVEIV